MALTQERPYQKKLFVDDGSIDASELCILIDHPSWTTPKRIPPNFEFTGGAGISLHIEKGKLEGLSSRNVSVTFDTAFASAPVGDVQVYRMAEVATGKWRKEEVLWGFSSANQPSTTGFSLVIDDTESLTGIVIEFIYQ